MKFGMSVFGRFFLRLILTGIVGIVIVSLVSRCGSSAKTEEKSALEGTWVMQEYLNDEMIDELFSSIGFTEEEIAIIDTRDFYAIKKIKFYGLNYSIDYDISETKAHVMECFEDIFETLYKNRDKLEDTCGDISDMTESEFKTLYAMSYGYSTYNLMLNYLTANSFNYAMLELSSESGMFDFAGGKIELNRFGGGRTVVGYSIEADQLTLTYRNGEEIYFRELDISA